LNDIALKSDDFWKLKLSKSGYDSDTAASFDADGVRDKMSNNRSRAE